MRDKLALSLTRKKKKKWLQAREHKIRQFIRYYYSTRSLYLRLAGVSGQGGKKFKKLRKIPTLKYEKRDGGGERTSLASYLKYDEIFFFLSIIFFFFS